ncbi:DUF3631 domain-containing protein [Terrabacter aeriphilus]|uniref:DUF3631 domain-containing protein n=1 Tax=Terrabacter aeriphilus TaxID=515662 RepID=A0ABP9JBV2_9MICO
MSAVPDLRVVQELDEDPAGLLLSVERCLRRYCVLPSEHAYVAVALWVATTHVLPAFDYAPRLVARSAEKRSGESRLVEVVAGLVHSPLRTVNVSAPYIFRSLGVDHPPTILLDEADALFGTKVKAEQNEDLRGLLNAGHQRGLTYGRCEGPNRVPTDFPTFAMALVAGIGSMPDTIEDRAVVLAMRRRKDSEVVSSFRQKRDGPGLETLRDRLHDWGEEAVSQLEGAEPTMPPGVDDRAADTWEPLLAVADCVGGDWPDRARAAATHFVLATEDDDQAQSIGVQLLADIRRVFEKFDDSEISSHRLVHALEDDDAAPWGDMNLNPSKLGRHLARYGIRTGHTRDKSKRVYRREDFEDAWERYLPSSPAPAAEELQQSPPTT